MIFPLKIAYAIRSGCTLLLWNRHAQHNKSMHRSLCLITVQAVVQMQRQHCFTQLVCRLAAVARTALNSASQAAPASWVVRKLPISYISLKLCRSLRDKSAAGVKPPFSSTTTCTQHSICSPMHPARDALPVHVNACTLNLPASRTAVIGDEHWNDHVVKHSASSGLS